MGKKSPSAGRIGRRHVAGAGEVDVNRNWCPVPPQLGRSTDAAPRESTEPFLGKSPSDGILINKKKSTNMV